MKSFARLLFLVLLLGGLAGALILVNRSQETRRGAAFGTADAWFLPDSANVSTANNFTVMFKIDAKDKRMNSVNVKLKFDRTKLTLVSVSPVVAGADFPSTVYNPMFKSLDDVFDKDQYLTTGNSLGTVVINGFRIEENRNNLPTGMVDVAKLVFAVKSGVSGTVDVEVDGSFGNTVTAHNPADTANQELTLDVTRKGHYTIGGGGATNTPTQTVTSTPTGGAKPDLVVSSITSEGIGTSYRFAFTVKNQGQAPVTASQTLRLSMYLDPELVGGQLPVSATAYDTYTHTGGLGVGETFVHVLSKATGGSQWANGTTHAIYGRVDTQRVIDESDETNNIRNISVTLAGVGGFVCRPVNQSCMVNADCCAGLYCAGNTCRQQTTEPTNTPVPTATPTPPCKWCGTSCVPSSFQQMCTMQAPEAGTSCRQDSDNNNRCTKFFTGTGNPPTAPEGCHYQSIACTTSMPPSCTYKLVCGGVTPTPTGTADECTDSDGGRVYGVVGTTCLGTNCTMDSCNAAGRLQEFYCDANGDKVSEFHMCNTAGGEKCFLNACRQCLADNTTCGSTTETSCGLCCNGSHQETDLTNKCGGGTATATPTPTEGQSNDMYLKVKLSFNGLTNNGQCIGDMPVSLVVLGGGVSKVYANVVPVRDTSVTDRAVYRIERRLTGFTRSSGVAVFLKGPKHIQMKYGESGQSGYYNQAGGELTLTSDPNTTPVYDFTAYSILAGDVNRDGTVNGADFSLLKRDNVDLKRVEANQGLETDLDGDCVVTNHDMQMLRLTLSEKQSQLY